MTRPGLLLGLDAGGSGTKWALLRGGERLAGGVSAPFTASLPGADAGAEALRALVAELPGRPDAVQAGVAGLDRASPRAEAIRQALAGALGVPAGRVGVESDLDLAYRAHLAPGAGILLYAGTGSVAYHVTAGGEVVRAGGHGHRIDDDGAAASLGRAALRWLTREQDRGHTPDTPLSREMAGVMGTLDWPGVRAFVYGPPGASALAQLAPAVGRAADAGDVVAGELLAQAAASLAELALTVQERVGLLPVTATGGALRVSAQLTGGLARALVHLRVQHRDHAEAAARAAEALL